MSKTKLVFAAFFSVLALSAVTATAALAGEWDVNGTKLVGSAALASSAKVLTHGELSISSGTGVSIVCESEELAINGGELVASDEVRAKDLTFKGCETVIGNPTCTLASKSVLTLPLHGLAELDGPLNTLVLILALPTKTFAAITFAGEKCALLGTQAVTGVGPIIDLLIHGGFDPARSHLILVLSLKGLKVGSSEATLLGASGDLELANGQSWNFL